ncbi:hypothetical protein PUN28_016792 [Cardiocondyla obscurior]|uniref:Uncharacterized protein n=1 Tax=Cardiocondyla obscurior TaxID=286306 RepID=A0AAW2ESI2_9HYME
MLRKFLIFILICVARSEYSYLKEDVYSILDRTKDYFKNLNDAHGVLNSETSNNINNEIAKYMSDTKEVLRKSTRQKRSSQNESNRGE